VNHRVRSAQRRTVFINCPFDDDYRPLFESIIFTVIALGFRPLCALDRDNAAQERLSKILGMIAECEFGIHDLSFMRLDQKTGLPRFNMPFELGLFLGSKSHDKKHGRKSCLILDKEQYRYRNSLSDLSGRDIKAHRGKPGRVVRAVRDWLVTEADLSSSPGATFVVRQYRGFRQALLRLCSKTRREIEDLTFRDYCDVAEKWLETNG
jgi:hypothetical protein